MSHTKITDLDDELIKVISTGLTIFGSFSAAIQLV